MKLMTIFFIIVASFCTLVSAEPEIQDTGIRVTGNTTYSALTIGDTTYGGTNGNEQNLAAFYSINRTTGNVNMFTRVEGNGIKAMVLSGNTIFFSTYTISGGLPSLYSYTIGDEKPIKLASIPKSSYAFSLATNKRYVFIGTFPNAIVFRYDKVNKKLLNWLDATDSGQYVSSMSLVGNDLYLACGVDLDVFKVNTITKEIKSILPPELSGKFYGHKLTNVDNFLYLENEPSKRVIRYNLTTELWEKVFDNLGNKPFEKLIPGSIIFNGYNGDVLGYHNDRTYRLASNLFGVDNKLNGVNNHSHLVYKNVTSKKTLLPENPIIPFDMTVSEGKIYASNNNYNAAGLTYESDLENKTICKLGDMLYMARYPGAKLYAQNLGYPRTNAYLIWDISEYGQTRPMQMSCKNNLVSIAFQPEYGKFGGGTAVFDVTTKRGRFYKNTDTVMAVKVTNLNKIVIGTSVYGSLGAIGMSSTYASLEMIGSWKILTTTDKILDLVIDEERGIIYVATGSGRIEYYDLDTGKRLDSFDYFGVYDLEIVNHDLYIGGKNLLAKFYPDTKEVTLLSNISSRLLTYDSFNNSLLFTSGFVIYSIKL